MLLMACFLMPGCSPIKKFDTAYGVSPPINCRTSHVLLYATGSPMHPCKQPMQPCPLPMQPHQGTDHSGVPENQAALGRAGHRPSQLAAAPQVPESAVGQGKGQARVRCVKPQAVVLDILQCVTSVQHCVALLKLVTGAMSIKVSHHSDVHGL